jgi:heptose-I-phosphate ethanolaminephosphotransferase
MSAGQAPVVTSANPATTSPLARVVAIAWLVASGIFLVSPAIVGPLLLGARSPGPLPVVAWNVAVSLVWIVVLHGWIRRPEVLHLLLAPLYVTTAVDLFLVLRMGSRLTSTHWIIFLTDFADVPGFVWSRGPGTWAALGAVLLVPLPGLLAMSRIRVDLPRGLRRAGVALLLLAYGVPLAWVATARPFPESLLEVASRDFSSPVGALSQAVVAALRLRETQVHVDRRRWAALDATRPAGRDVPGVFVWVIGDSSRPDRWSLGGYHRETNPLLASIEGVLFLPDVVTPAPYTGYAVPAMLSLARPEDWATITSRPSLLRAFGEVGFETWWISAQRPDSPFGIIHRVAEEASRRSYLPGSGDVKVVEELRARLASPNIPRKLLVVLHTRGNHFSGEIPRSFRRFTGGGTGAPADDGADEGARYDEGILLTDWVVSEVIRIVEARGLEGAVVYCSDHGESLLDPDGLRGHAIGNAGDYRTAALVWASPGLVEARPEAFARARSHVRARLRTGDLAHAFLDLAGIETPDQDPSRSILDARFRETRRSVQAVWSPGSVVDFDATIAPSSRPGPSDRR